MREHLRTGAGEPEAHTKCSFNSDNNKRTALRSQCQSQAGMYSKRQLHFLHNHCVLSCQYSGPNSYHLVMTQCLLFTYHMVKSWLFCLSFQALFLCNDVNNLCYSIKPSWSLLCTGEDILSQDFLVNFSITKLENLKQTLKKCKILTPKCVINIFVFFQVYRVCGCLAWLFSFFHFLMILFQNALVKGAAKELASLYGTKYTYGPGATTICESRVHNYAKKSYVQEGTNASHCISFLPIENI